MLPSAYCRSCRTLLVTRRTCDRCLVAPAPREWLGRLSVILAAAAIVFAIWFFGTALGCEGPRPPVLLPMEPIEGEETCTKRDISFRAVPGTVPWRGELALCEDGGIGLCSLWTCTSRTA